MSLLCRHRRFPVLRSAAAATTTTWWARGGFTSRTLPSASPVVAGSCFSNHLDARWGGGRSFSHACFSRGADDGGEDSEAHDVVDASGAEVDDDALEQALSDSGAVDDPFSFASRKAKERLEDQSVNWYPGEAGTQKWRMRYGSPTRIKTPHVPDARGDETVQSFLSKIGKDCEGLADKFEDWEDLFTAKTKMLKKRGIKVKQRKNILAWTEKYRHGVDPGTCKDNLYVSNYFQR